MKTKPSRITTKAMAALAGKIDYDMDDVVCAVMDGDLQAALNALRTIRGRIDSAITRVMEAAEKVAA